MAVAAISEAPSIQYRCRAIGDVTTPPRIRAALAVTDDLTKGDGSTAGTYPTFVATATATGIPSHYVFDGVDDYVSSWPTMPDDYTVAAVVDTGDGPELWSCNDSTIKDALTVSGAWSGKLYRLGVWDSELSAAELAKVEYWWVYHVPRLGAKGIEHRLILEGNCKAAVFCAESDPEEDRAESRTWAETGISYGADGADFTGNTAGLRAAEFAGGSGFSAVIFADHDFTDGTSGFVGFFGGVYFKITVASGTVTADFCGSELVVPQGDVYGVSAEPSNYPAFYVDGKYIGDGDALAPSDLSDLGTPIIGNRI